MNASRQNMNIVTSISESSKETTIELQYLHSIINIINLSRFHN